ncbi:hypothetical protein [Pseudomonas sp. 58 R 3]|nr:hypothetical protein [Pseudomonas sp. 58 R 3]
MGAQHFAVQAVAFEIADDLAVEVDLVQMAAAVVQAVEPAAVRQLGLDQVAEFVVVVLQVAVGTLFGQQLADSVIGETQSLGVALQIRAEKGTLLFRRKMVNKIRPIFLVKIKASNTVAFKPGKSLKDSVNP